MDASPAAVLVHEREVPPRASRGTWRPGTVEQQSAGDPAVPAMDSPEALATTLRLVPD